MIVLKDFYCTHTNISYKAGDVYKGNRTDISYLLEGEIEIDYVEVTPKFIRLRKIKLKEFERKRDKNS